MLMVSDIAEAVVVVELTLQSLPSAVKTGAGGGWVDPQDLRRLRWAQTLPPG